MSAPRESAFRRVVDQLGKTQKVIEDKPDRHAKVQCPLSGHEHGDRDPSLRITWIEGSILLACHCSPGRTYLEIAHWLGWPVGELLHDGSSGKTIYPYSDGRRVTRSYDDQGEKHFTQRGHKKGQRTVLYHLERITEARSKGEPIMLVGSEKDVHALESIGAYATCAPMGEGNWHLVDHTPLHGMEVIAIAHRDDQGTRWAQAVRVDLEDDCALGFALPAVDREKADAADHVAEGYSLAQLVPWVPPPVDDGGTDNASADDLAREVEATAYGMRVRDLARQKLAQEAAGELTMPDMIRLTEFLAQPDPEDRYLIDQNWPKGGRVLFAAQWKAGKSTARDNVARSLADGEPFLGVFKVKPITEGTIVLFDDELHPDMLRRWLREQGIVNTDRVVVVPMRGQVSAFDLRLPDVRAMWVRRLIEFRAVVVLLDCLRPILDALGLSENAEAGRFLVAFDQMLDEAKIAEAMIVHHMGHFGERARGDSRILDWGDSLWKLVLDEDDKIPMDERARYFSAFGRGVSVRESRLSYDESIRRLSISGGTRRESKGEEAWPDVREFVRANPDCSANRIETKFEGTHSKEAVRAAINAAEKRGDLHIERTGKGLANLHRLKETIVVVIETAQPTIEEATSPTSPDLATANRRTHLATSPTSPIGRGGGGGTEEVGSRSTTGEVVVSVIVDLDLRWRTLTVVTSDLDLRWRTRTQVTSDLDLRWRTESPDRKEADQ